VVWIAVAVFASVVVWAPTPASAKGAIDAVLRGTDVSNGGVVTLDQDQTTMLALSTSFYVATWGTGTSRVPAASEPTDKLGPKYVVTYNLMGGQDETLLIRQRLYPFAKGGPVAFVPPGQRVQAAMKQRFSATGKVLRCERCEQSVGGWFDVRYGALDVLRDVGVPIPAGLDRSNWPTTRDDAHGLSISYPPSWHAAPSTLTPVLADPIVPLAVGTAAMVPQRPGDCDIVPQRAVEAVGPTDALVLVSLYQGMASRSAKLQRPFVFGPDLPWQTGPVQCTDGNADVTVSTLSFEDGEARISVMVVVGKNASPQREAEIYAVLDSLRSL